MNEAISQRQSEVSAHGTAWEKYVANFLKNRLSLPYETFLETEIPPDIYSKLCIPPSVALQNEIDLSNLGDSNPIFGDVDIVVIKNNQPIVIVSCKISLHSRLTETLFYSVLYERMGVRMVLATPDKGSSGRTEWGTPLKPTKNRLLSRRFLYGVYIEYHDEHTEYPAPV